MVGTHPFQKDWDELFEHEQRVLIARAAARVAGDAQPAAQAGTDYLSGICLSGGGIRSASVSLGALQALAGAKLIQHLDYVSSVSGGGYTGAALSFRYAQAAAGGATDPDAAFPFETSGSAIARLRHAANYLAPRGFPSLLTGFFVVARSLVLNVFIWLFLGGLAFALLMALFFEEQRSCMLLPWVPADQPCGAAALFDWLLVAATALSVLLAALVIGFSLSGWRLTTNPAGTDAPTVAKSGEIYPGARLAIAVVAAFAAWWLHALLGFGTLPAVATVTLALLAALWALVPLIGPKWGPRLVAWLCVGAALLIAGAAWRTDIVDGFAGDSRSKVALLALLAIAALLRGISRRTQVAGPEISPKYARRRVQERCSSFLLVAIAFCLIFAAVPLVPALAKWLADGMNGAPDLTQAVAVSFPTALLYLVSGAAALFGFYRTRLKGVLGAGTSFLLIAGSGLLFYVTAVLAYRIGFVLFGAGKEAVNSYLTGIPLLPLTTWQAVCIAGVIAAFFLAFIININDVSLGRYYRDRLAEAFMPDEQTGVEDFDRPATEADRFRLTEIAGFVEPEPPAARSGTGSGGLGERVKEMMKRAPSPSPARLLGPYPLVNTYVVRRRSPSAMARRRGGDSFLLSPLFCGSTETGWKRTPDVIQGELSLATSMAISGAAANPGGGLAGRGITTNFVVLTAMAFLCLRLGYTFRWSPDTPIRTWLNPFGNHIFPAATELGAELLGVPSNGDTFVELSDGGHFENLGLYELVRRRCGLIIVIDGGQDAGASYEAFVSAITLIREDFATEFAFDVRVRGHKGLEPSGPQQVVARPAPDEYPRAAEFARRGYFLASVRYPKRHTPTRVPMAQEGPEEGLIIYLKSAMIPGLSLSSRGYKGAFPEFPYESTVDQFFSPEQFEAYREVGEQIARQMITEKPTWSASSPAAARPSPASAATTPSPPAADAPRDSAPHAPRRHCRGGGAPRLPRRPLRPGGAGRLLLQRHRPPGIRPRLELLRRHPARRRLCQLRRRLRRHHRRRAHDRPGDLRGRRRQHLFHRPAGHRRHHRRRRHPRLRRLHHHPPDPAGDPGSALPPAFHRKGPPASRRRPARSRPPRRLRALIQTGRQTPPAGGPSTATSPRSPRSTRCASTLRPAAPCSTGSTAA